MWKICFFSLFANWEGLRCVREGKEWWSLCSMLKGRHYPDSPRQMCTERKHDIAFPKSGNNEHSLCLTKPPIQRCFFLSFFFFYLWNLNLNPLKTEWGWKWGRKKEWTLRLNLRGTYKAGALEVQNLSVLSNYKNTTMAYSNTIT